MLSVRTKLIIALLLTAIVAVALVGLVAHWRLAQKFSEVVLGDSFREYRKDVAAYFTTYGSWEQGEATEPFTRFVVRRHNLLGMSKSQGMRWQQKRPGDSFGVELGGEDIRVPPLTGPPDLAPGVPPSRLPPFRFLLLDPNGRVLRETPPHKRGEIAPPDVVKAAFPIHAQGTLVALAVPIGQPMLSAFDLGYLDAMREALVFGALVAIGLAALLGIALGTGLTRALRRLIDAVQAVSRGQLGLQVKVTSRDEIGALATAFNQMSVDLATSRAALQEQTQRADAARKTAEEANRAKSSFLAAASHDLRQPLHALGLFVSTLRRTRSGALADEALDNIEGSLEALRALFEELLDISRLDAGVIEPRVRPWPVQDLLTAIAREAMPLAEQKGLRLRVVPSALSVESDPVLLGRMLRNLVTNAIRYTAQGGVLVGCRREGQRARVEVWDTGIGIAPAELDRIFREFYQVPVTGPERQQGLGLGLSIVERLGRLLGHEVRVASVPGKGSKFSISLPVAAVASVAPTAEAAPLADVGRKDAVVLVIEDQASIRRGMETLLREWGYRPMLARNSGEALAHARTAAPDFIVTDYQLGNGATCLSAIHAVNEACGRKIPAVIVTGDTGTESLREAIASGHVVLHKPIMPAKLRAVLMRMLATP